MSEDQDKSNKTEEPTQKRLDEARSKGQIYNSREINSFLLLFALALLIGGISDSVFREAKYSLANFITQPDQMPTDAASLLAIMTETMRHTLSLMTAPMLGLLMAALAAGFIQKPLIWSVESLMPKWEKVSPVKGLSRMFSMRSLTEFVKGVIKITIVGFVATIAIWPHLTAIKALPSMGMDGLLIFMKEITLDMLIGVLIAMFFIALFDYMYQRFDYIRNLRMSKQEIRDEYKQQEGDPKIKAKLRQLRAERARKRMMAEVPTSDVVITNPTHFAVALKYDNARMDAPLLVAKGQDRVALKIREVAKENDVPIVENPPLARALFTCELDAEVPVEHYKAVAEIISYVYKLKRKTLRPR